MVQLPASILLHHVAGKPQHTQTLVRSVTPLGPAELNEQRYKQVILLKQCAETVQN